MPGGRNSGAVYNMYKVKEIQLLMNLTHMLISVVSDGVSGVMESRIKSTGDLAGMNRWCV